MSKKEILILGLGWQGSYLRDLCVKQNISVSATSTSSKPDTIPFKFDSEAKDPTEYLKLPLADNIVITFPLPTVESPSLFMNLYKATHPTANANLIIYGSTRAWHGTPTNPWANRNGPLTPDARFNTEEAVLKIGGCVLNLAGLYGGTRHPRNWIVRVAPTKDELLKKDSLHLIHGIDVARLTIAVTRKFSPGQRWLVSDMRIYDWWELAMAFGNEEQQSWVQSLITENKLNCLPRTPDSLTRCLDSVETWRHFGQLPLESLYQK